MSEIYEFECNELEEMLIVNYQEGFAYNMSYEDDVYSVAVKLNELQATIEQLKKKNKTLQQLLDVSMKADEEFFVFDDLKYIESALTFLIDNSLETQCVECEREDIHFVAERLKIVLGSLDNE